MINVLYFSLMLLYAASITYPIPGIVIFALSILFFALSYRKFKLESSSKATALVQIMCYSIPLSWRNVFGGDYGSLPISWFYVIGFLLLIHLFNLKKNIKLKYYLFATVLITIFTLAYSWIPLAMTNPDYFNSGVSLFIVLSFHNIMVLAAILKGGIISEENVIDIEKSYVAAGFITSLGIITQFALFKFGTTIGTIIYYLNRQSFYFIFSDVSHATLYLATTSFLAIQLLNKKLFSKKHALIPIITLIGAAITSARTGLVVFFAVYMIYILLAQKKFIRKLSSIIIGIISLFCAYTLFMIVRPQSDVYQILFDSSGRYDGYNTAINMFLENPILGYGLSKEYISDLTGLPIPHFSFLQYLIHAGIFYTLIIFGVVSLTYFHARKYKMNESWLILLTTFGTCFIPDFFSTRYITLLMVIVFLKSTPNSYIAYRSGVPSSIESVTY